MMTLTEYVRASTERGACQCGRCIDAPANPQETQPMGHTADLIFFKVALKNGTDAETLRTLIQQQQGEFCEVNPLDGKEHNYLELGGWVGDQDTALQLMGLGSLLGLWDLLTPKTMLPGVPDEMANQMAGMGMVAIQAKG